MHPSHFAKVALLLATGLPAVAAADVPADSAKPSTKVAKARPPRCVTAPFDLALTPRISLNGLRRPCARNFLGLALGGSRAGQLRGVQIGLGVNGVERDAIGAQIAVGINAVGGDTTALQIAGLINANGDRFTGIQLAGLINAAGDDVTALQIALLGNASGGRARGVQLAGLFNASGGEVRGFQASGLFNASGDDVRGVQVAGLFNAAGDRVRGLQISALANAAGDGIRAVQVAGLVNATGEQATGAQVAGLLNAATRMRGAQIAGAMNAADTGEGLQLALAYNRVTRGMTGVQIAAVNVGGDVAGAQIGLVNVASRVRGMQLGLVNVADRASAPIGAVSWVRSGERALELWSGEALSAAGLRLGTDRVYSIVGVASGPLADGAPWGAVGGAGVQFPLGRIRLLADALAHTLFFDGAEDQAVLAQARARLAYDLTDHIAVTAGPTWNVFVSEDVDGADLPLGPDTLDRSGGTAVRQWPGFVAGGVLRL